MLCRENVAEAYKASIIGDSKRDWARIVGLKTVSPKAKKSNVHRAFLKP